jgi:hypothetical protein
MRANLFLVGAAKSGTTALADYLDQHPEIWICRPKEPNFFAYPPGQRPTCRGPCEPARLYDVLLAHSITDPIAYEELFQTADSVRFPVLDRRRSAHPARRSGRAHPGRVARAN